MTEKLPEIDVDLEALNHSELVLLAHWADMRNVSRAIPRDMIITALRTMEPINIPNPADPQRTAMSQWLRRRWSSVQMQAPKSECPECFKCRDIQAIECHANNCHQFR
jgi:hypothetical protein